MRNKSTEKELLAILVSGPELLADNIDKIKEEYFKEPNSIHILRGIKKAYIEDVPFSESTVNHYVPKACDTTWLFEKIEYSQKILETYLKIIRSSYLRKELEVSGGLLIEQSLDSSNDPEHLIEKFEDRLQQLSQGNSAIVVSDFKSVIKSTLKTIKEHFASRVIGELVGIDLVTDELNSRTGGARKGELTIISGRPGMSKSGLCLNIVEANSMNGTKRGLVFSLEMSNEVVGERLIAQRLGTNLSNLHTGFLSKPEMARMYAPIKCNDCESKDVVQSIDYKHFVVENACTECGSTNILTYMDSVMNQEYPIHIIQQAGLSIYQICSLMKAHKIKFPDLEYVVVDHLHCVGYAPGANQNEKLGHICGALRDTGKNIDVAVILAAQLSRAVEAEPDKRPLLKHLRESGAIEQWADLVLMLFRQSYYDKTNTNTVVDFDIDIAKQRNGPTGIVSTVLDLQSQKFYKNK